MVALPYHVQVIPRQRTHMQDNDIERWFASRRQLQFALRLALIEGLQPSLRIHRNNSALHRAGGRRPGAQLRHDRHAENAQERNDGERHPARQQRIGRHARRQGKHHPRIRNARRQLPQVFAAEAAEPGQ